MLVMAEVGGGGGGGGQGVGDRDGKGGFGCTPSFMLHFMLPDSNRS